MPDTPDPVPALGFLFGDISRLLRRNFNRRAQPLGLTITQGRALAHLSRNEGISQTELAGLLEIQPITLTRLIDRMEALDWVERRPDPHDRRAVQLFMTKKVQPVLAQVWELLDLTFHDAVADLSEATLAQTAATLEEMKRNLLSAEPAPKRNARKPAAAKGMAPKDVAQKDAANVA